MRLIASFFLIIAFLWSVAHAQPVRTGNAVAELVSERAAIAPGDQFLVALKLDIDEGWHVYWKNPGDSGLPAEINWVVPEGVSFSDFTWPVPHEQPLDGLMNYGYETQLVLPLTVNAPSGYQAGDTLNLEGAASWLICKDICIPEDARLNLSLPVAAAPVEDLANGAFIASALEASPMALTGEAVAEDLGDAYRVSLTGPMFADALNDAVKVRIFPDTHAIEHPAEQSVRVGADGAQIDLTKSNLAPAELANFSGVVAVEAADGARRGFRFDATPGVAPTGVSDRALSLSGAGATSTRGGETLGFAGLLTYLALAFIGGMILN
ncbi:MAG: protein-disulfide reductase DsbD domain-containing protein, partial [Pseudomonadota bacterium]